MIAVIFEVSLNEAGQDEYFDIAAELKPLLAQMEGFISVERFQSLVEPDKYLSLSFWRDEAAVKAWRELECHRAAQRKGKSGLFRDYRIRVAQVEREYGMRKA